MMFSCILVLLVLMGSFFPLLSQPFSLGVMLFSVASLLSLLFSGVLSSWVGMILFLIYVGGMLVMFIFVISFLPNISFPFVSFFISFIMAVFLSLLIGGFNFYSWFVLKSEVETLYLSNFFLDSANLSVYLGLVSILFVILVGVATLCFSQKNTMRGYK
uniref:NADH dehydrogenase subunit 6 n=1 Tax=Falcidens halanychi TaxID=370642 RepID=A0A343X884_9MOLL|nr:NADH dehydrogenase subunit 6 [Falcidens halanychi]AWH02143.1 NADH dehydrogenase subunit 6 [Falcidens halanychi]